MRDAGFSVPFPRNCTTLAALPLEPATAEKSDRMDHSRGVGKRDRRAAVGCTCKVMAHRHCGMFEVAAARSCSDVAPPVVVVPATEVEV